MLCRILATLMRGVVRALRAGGRGPVAVRVAAPMEETEQWAKATRRVLPMLVKIQRSSAALPRGNTERFEHCTSSGAAASIKPSELARCCCRGRRGDREDRTNRGSRIGRLRTADPSGP